MRKKIKKSCLPREMPQIKFDQCYYNRVEVFNYKKQSFDVWYRGLCKGEAFFIANFIIKLSHSFIVKVVHTHRKIDFVTFYFEA